MAVLSTLIARNRHNRQNINFLIRYVAFRLVQNAFKLLRFSPWKTVASSSTELSRSSKQRYTSNCLVLAFGPKVSEEREERLALILFFPLRPASRFSTRSRR